VSEWRACAAASQHRSSQRYRRKQQPDEEWLRERLRLLARKHPRYGYRRIHVILRREGWVCNRKRVQRLWRDEGLRLPAKPRRRRRGAPWQNPYAESFNGHLRRELLDMESFNTLHEAQLLVEDWRLEYNHYRPHRTRS